MKNFRRALGHATSYWPTIAMATACSFAVAALWGANIGAFFPILEVTIDNKSMHTWIDEQIATSQETANASLAAVEKQEAVVAALGDLDDKNARAQRTELADLKSQHGADQARLIGYQESEPWIKSYIPSDPFQTIALIVCALILSTLVKHVFLITNEMLVGRVALDISRNIRMQVFEKALHMGRKEYSTYGTAGFSATITHTTEMLSRGLMNTLGAALREPLKVVSCLAGAAFICWRLLLLSVVVAPLVGWMLYLVTRKLKDVAKTMLSKADGFHNVMLESLGNVNTVQSYRMEAAETKRFDVATMAMQNFGLKFIFYTSLSKPIIEFLGLGMLGTTIIGGAYLVLNQQTSLMGIPICDEPLSVSALLVFFGLLVGVSDPLRKLSAVYSSIYAGSMAADALYPILDYKVSIEDPVEPQAASFPHNMLQIENVDFGYDESHPILRNVSLEIPFGSTVAIVGHNGSGKSTLIHLLSRFYDPTQGSMKFDGIDFRDMKIDDVRKRIALVTQHTELFNDTVAYNIRYGSPEATDEQVYAAARDAHATDFIDTALSDSFETVVGANGSKLSGGQRQRIALARALLCNPEILILDEATSQIDMQSEQLIRESLSEHRGERTMIIITHREKLLELADHVFEVVDGQLVPRPNLLSDAA